MKKRPPPGSTVRARRLRRNPTDAEVAMLRLLRENFSQARFRCQVPIRHYLADFASHRAKLIVEVDGGQHSVERDAKRTADLEAEGYRVIRFWNHEVLENGEGCMTRLAESLPAASPPSNCA